MNSIISTMLKCMLSLSYLQGCLLGLALTWGKQLAHKYWICWWPRMRKDYIKIQWIHVIAWLHVYEVAKIVKLVELKGGVEFPLSHSGLRTCCCCSYDVGHSHSSGSIPGPRTSIRHRCGQKKKRENCGMVGAKGLGRRRDTK